MGYAGNTVGNGLDQNVLKKDAAIMLRKTEFAKDMGQSVRNAKKKNVLGEHRKMEFVKDTGQQLRSTYVQAKDVPRMS